MTDYTLYYCPQTRAFGALWMLEEAGASYAIETIDIRDPEASEAWRAVNPMRKVPALKAGEEFITEAAAICAFLADAHPQAGLAPKIGEAGRGAYLRWMYFAGAAIEPAFIDKAFGRETPHSTSGWGHVDSVLRTLREALDGRDWLVGGRFTAADLVVGGTIDAMLTFKLLEPEPVFTDYAERLHARPAHMRASAIEAERGKALYGE